MDTARSLWAKMDGERSTLMKRMENYARLTIPKLLLPTGFNLNDSDQPHDYQSFGAQAVNHVTNKIMLAMFAPSRPFFRLQPGPKAQAEASQVMTEDDLATLVSTAERNSVKELDATAQRPKLYQLVRHIVVLGNVLLFRDKDEFRVMSLRYFCVKRTVTGKVHTLIINERVCFDELDPEIQAIIPAKNKKKDDSKVDYFKWIKREPDGSYSMTQWIEDVNLGTIDDKYNDSWASAEDCPYTVHTWDLADEADYGTGLVEEYVGDFEAMSSLSEAVVDGAILGAEFRWLVNPSGQTTVEDVKNSVNGDVLPGVPEDVQPTQAGNAQAVQQAAAVLDRWERRLGRGFLLQSAIQRDAERVTAEEIRMAAMELETAFGGVYSALAPGLQRPIAKWLLMRLGMDLNGSDFTLTIITGLDALSRNSDVENLKLALMDAAAIATLPPALQAELSMPRILTFIGNGRGVDIKQFLKTQDEKQQEAEELMAQQAAMAAAQTGGENLGNQVQ